jgi:hypothetical protein
MAFDVTNVVQPGHHEESSGVPYVRPVIRKRLVDHALVIIDGSQGTGRLVAPAVVHDQLVAIVSLGS